MNKEQNIDDILKLLKNSYDGTGDSSVLVEEDSSDKESISHDELQRLLREQFVGEEPLNTVSNSEESEYKLDDDFITEAEAIEQETTEPEKAEDALQEETEEEELDTLPDENDIIDERDDDEYDEYQDEVYDQDDDGYPPFDLEDYSVESATVGTIFPQTLEETIESEDSDQGVTYDGFESEEEEEEEEDPEPELEEVLEAEVEEAEEEYFSHESGQLALFEHDGTDSEHYESEEETELEEQYDENQIVLDFGDTYEDGDTSADAAVISDARGTAEPNVDGAFLGLMLEFGDNVAIGKNVSTERVDIYNERNSKEDVSKLDISETFGFEGEEYEDPDQADDVLESYSRDKKFTLVRLLGCGVFSVLLLLFEMLPHLPIELFGILDHTKYPAVYMLFSLQLLILAGAFAWRELWSGLRKAFCLRSDLWSLSSLVVLAVIIYEVLMTFISRDGLPLMFGSIAAIYIFIGLLCEYLSVKREQKSFEVYSCDSVKYTFETEPIANSAAEKMYRGGVSSKVNIFEPREVKFPKGYFAEVNRSPEPDMLINTLITPIVLISAAMWVGAMMLGMPFYSSLEVLLVSLTALCPMAVFASRILPMYIASSRLYYRESAIASEVSARKYASCDIMIFRDSHLFCKSRAEDNGIIIYDQKDTAKIVSYLDALYSAIGGPMKELFSGVGDKKYVPRLRRISRNGIEAVINSQSVILGDIEFQHRYGVSFSDKELQQHGEGILCLSIDGVPAAKLCLRYKTEPIFEMIVSNMEENGIKCAIETYDPVINSSFVAASRAGQCAPINVVHKNVTDYYSEMPEDVECNTGLLACSSRLKLVECVIWCKKIFSAKKSCLAVHFVFSALTLALLVIALGFGFIDKANEYWVMALQMLGIIPTMLCIYAKLPSKKYLGANTQTKNKKERNRENTDE